MASSAPSPFSRIQSVVPSDHVARGRAVTAVEFVDVALHAPLEVDHARAGAAATAAAATTREATTAEADRRNGSVTDRDGDGGGCLGVPVEGSDGKHVFGLFDAVKQRPRNDRDLGGVRLDLEQRAAPGEAVHEHVPIGVLGRHGCTDLCPARGSLNDRTGDLGGVELRGVVDPVDGHEDGRPGRVRTGGNGVGEALDPVRVGVRGIAEGVVGIEDGCAVAWRLPQRDRQRLVLWVGVVVQHVNQGGRVRVLVGLGGVVDRHGRFVHVLDGDRHRSGVRSGGGIGRRDRDAVGVLRLAVQHRAHTHPDLAAGHVDGEAVGVGAREGVAEHVAGVGVGRLHDRTDARAGCGVLEDRAFLGGVGKRRRVVDDRRGLDPVHRGCLLVLVRAVTVGVGRPSRADSGRSRRRRACSACLKRR